jgi:DNA repair protein RecO (recombination protein O)
MIVSLNAIVLSKLKYNDNDLIVKCFTLQKGIVSYILKGVLKSKKNKRIAFFQLLTQLEIETDFKPNRSLHYVKDIKNHILYSSIHQNVYKSAIAMFVSDVLANALKEEEQNEALFNYIEAGLNWLDETPDFSNFHLLFLLKLTKYLGFYPDVTHSEFPYFNLVEGAFEFNKTHEQYILGEDLIYFKAILGTNFDALNEIKMSSNQRQRFLIILVKYYELHLIGFKKPKSLQILNEVFN